MFTVPAPTAFDLNWRMFGTHVRVSPFFWLMSAFLGWGLVQSGGLSYLILWILCVFISVLLHEFGHVGMGRLFGSEGHIILYGFGGLAVGSSDLRNRWQRVAVLLGGPGSQLLLWGLLLMALWFLREHPDHPVHGFLTSGTPQALHARAAVGFLLEINLFWAVLNLLPVWPLDGGQITREMFGWLMPDRGIVLSLWASFGVAALLAAKCVAELLGHSLPLLSFIPVGGKFGAIMFGLLAAGSYMALQQEQAPRTPRDDPGPWHREHDDRDW